MTEAELTALLGKPSIRTEVPFKPTYVLMSWSQEIRKLKNGLSEIDMYSVYLYKGYVISTRVRDLTEDERAKAEQEVDERLKALEKPEK